MLLIIYNHWYSYMGLIKHYKTHLLEYLNNSPVPKKNTLKLNFKNHRFLKVGCRIQENISLLLKQLLCHFC